MLEIADQQFRKQRAKKKALGRKQKAGELEEKEERLHAELSKKRRKEDGEDGDGDEDEGGGDDEEDVSEEEPEFQFETFDPTPGSGGTYQSPRWSDHAPRQCDTWPGGPFKHLGGANASIAKAVWIQNHGNNTAGQHLAYIRRHGRGGTADRLHSSLRYHHQASLAHLPTGWILAAWQAAEDTEGEHGQHIRLAVSRDGKRWSSSWMLPVPKAGAQWAPIPHVDSGGRLMLFYAESEGGCIRPAKPKPKWPPGGSIKMTYFDATAELTENTTWATPREVYSIKEEGFIPKMISGRLLVLSTGEYVLPFWRENALLSKTVWPDEKAHCRTQHNRAGQTWTNHAQPSAGILVSVDNGETWEARGKLEDAPVPQEGDDWSVGQRFTWLIENSVVEREDGSLLMFFRTNAGFIYQATSTDQGYEWTLPEPTSVHNPDSKSELFSLTGKGGVKGPMMLAYNDHQPGKIIAEGKTTKLPPKCHTLLSLAISSDEGKSFRRVVVLRGGSAPGLRFHYPWVLQLGCKLLVAYSKFYVTGYKHTENDRELGIRLSFINM